MNPRCVRCRAEIVESDPRCLVGWLPPHTREPSESAYLCFACSGVLQPADLDGEHMTELVGEAVMPNPRVAALSMALDLHSTRGKSDDPAEILKTARLFAEFVEEPKVEISE